MAVSIKAPRIYEINQNFKDDTLEAYPGVFQQLALELPVIDSQHSSLSFLQTLLTHFKFCKDFVLSICAWLIASFNI